MSTQPDAANAAPIDAKATDIIVARDVHKWFGQLHVLRGINLTVKAGEVVVIFGASGSGKSTFIRTINRLEEHQRGEIFVDGIELTDDIRNIAAVRSEIGMVFQSFNLFPHLTALQNITLAPMRVRRWSRDRAEEVGMQLMTRVGIPEQAHKFPAQLSGGQQQRVAIARATVLEPSLVLMDEPLSNLDAKLRLEMRTEIRRLHQSLGLTTVYVTHDQEEALSMADRLVVMRLGRVQQIGTPEEVHTKPATWHVADFMGYRNLLPLTASRVDGDAVVVPLGGTTVEGVGQHPGDPDASALAAGDQVVAAVRPEDVRLGNDDVTGLRGRVEVVEYQGRELAAEVALPDGTRLHTRTDRKVEPGEHVSITITPGRLLVYPSEGSADLPTAELATAGLAV